MRRAGLGVVAGLVACLGAVLVALAGGPQAPFTHWAAPRAGAPAVQSHVRSGAHHRGGVGPSRPDPQAGPVPSASPSGKASPRPRPSASAAPVPTNRAGRTPPGLTKSPNPHRSTHAP
jgi:hypothetical protein